MKLWNKIKNQAVKVKDNFWRWWKNQDTFKEKGPGEQTIKEERAASLMAWADDGGPLPRHHSDSKDKLE